MSVDYSRAVWSNWFVSNVADFTEKEFVMAEKVYRVDFNGEQFKRLQDALKVFVAQQKRAANNASSGVVKEACESEYNQAVALQVHISNTKLV